MAHRVELPAEVASGGVDAFELLPRGRANPSPTTTRGAWLGRGAWASIVVVLLVQCYRFVGYSTDDAYISFRYARRLVRGLGLTWTDGEAVEGYSDLLWVLLVAALDPFGTDALRSAHVLGVFGAVLALWAVSVDPMATTRPLAVRALTGGAMLAVSASLAIWAVGGLEHTFLAGIFAAGMVALVRSTIDGGRGVWVAALLFGAAVLTRADGLVLWVGALLGVALTTSPRSWPRSWPAAAIPMAALAGQLLFRLAYYGDWVPNTARVKVSFTWERAGRGLEWMAAAMMAHPGLVLGALLAVVLLRERSPRVGVPAAVALVWTGYGAFVGGDTFHGWRMFVPALPAYALLVAEGAARGPGRVGLLVSVPLLVLQVGFANTGPMIEEISTVSGWVPLGREVGLTLRRAWGKRRPLLAVDAAGAVPYWSELPALDLLGLTDQWLPRHPPKNFGKLRIGHDLGNGDYVWSRAPDVLLFSSTVGRTDPRYVSGREMVQRDDFDAFYQVVHLWVHRAEEHVRVVLYVRKEEGRLALERSDEEVVVPSWFLASEVENAARLDRKGALRAWVRPAIPGRAPSILLPAGTWTSSGDGMAVELGCGPLSATPVAAGTGGERALRLDEPTRVDILAWPAEGASAFASEVRIGRTAVEATHVCAAVPTVPLAQLQTPLDPGATPDSQGTLHFGAIGARVALAERAHPDRVDLWLEAGQSYVVRWLRGGEWVTSSVVQRVDQEGLAQHRVPTPADVRADGIDGFEVRPSGPSGVLGQVRLSTPNGG